MRKLRSFLKNTSGQIAVVMGICIFPLIGAVGLSVDYAFLSKEKTYLQAQADKLALERRGGEWLSQTLYKVELTEQKNTHFIAVLGIPKANVHVKAVAHVSEPVYTYIPPAFSSLEGEADDYNVIGFYCYSATAGTRTHYTRIADNRGGTEFTSPETCPAGDTVEYYVWNSRFAPRTPLRQNVECTLQRFEAGRCRTNVYLTDKSSKNPLSSDIGSHIGERDAYVETVLCDTLSDCLKPNCTSGTINCLNYKKDGGKIPDKKRNRTPEVSLEKCSPGKYMFYGFEDRQPGTGEYVDHDFDDVVLITACPDVTPVEGKKVFLVQ